MTWNCGPWKSSSAVGRARVPLQTSQARKGRRRGAALGKLRGGGVVQPAIGAPQLQRQPPVAVLAADHGEAVAAVAEAAEPRTLHHAQVPADRQLQAGRAARAARANHSSAITTGSTGTFSMLWSTRKGCDAAVTTISRACRWLPAVDGGRRRLDEDLPETRRGPQRLLGEQRGPGDDRYQAGAERRKCARRAGVTIPPSQGPQSSASTAQAPPRRRASAHPRRRASRWRPRSRTARGCRGAPRPRRTGDQPQRVCGRGVEQRPQPADLGLEDQIELRVGLVGDQLVGEPPAPCTIIDLAPKASRAAAEDPRERRSVTHVHGLITLPRHPPPRSASSVLRASRPARMARACAPSRAGASAAPQAREAATSARFSQASSPSPWRQAGSSSSGVVPTA